MVQPSFLADSDVLQHASLVDFTPPEEKHDSRSKANRHSDRNNKDKDDTPAPLKAHATAHVEHGASVTRTTLTSTTERGVRPQDLMLVPGESQSSSQQQLDSMPDAQVSTSMPPPALKPSTSRHAADKKKLREKRARFKAPGPRMPILSDARAECVLAAARKIGRVRAGIAAGLVRERERKESEAQMPAEGEPGPSNYAAVSGSMPSLASPSQMRVGLEPHSYVMPGLVYVQAVPSPPGARAAQAPVPQGAMMVPMWPMQRPGTLSAGRQLAVNQQQTGGRGRAQGSLDSLLTAATAARTMIVGDEDGSAGAGEETEKEDDEEEEERQVGKARAAKRPQRRKSGTASAPKRRKMGTSASASTGGVASATRAGRTRKPTKKALEAQDQAQDRKGKGKQREAPTALAHVKGKANGIQTHVSPVHVAQPPPPASAPVARVRSALDVLAEQAAQEQEWMPVSGQGSPSAEAASVRRARLGPAAVVRTQREQTEELGPEEENVGDGDVEDADANASENGKPGWREASGQAGLRAGESVVSRRIEPIDV